MPVQLNIDTINMILNYLGTRPFNEVANMVQAIRDEVLPQLQPAEQPVEPPTIDE